MHLGSGSKNGPIHKSIKSKIKHDTILANCVFPPTLCWIKDLLSDADTGMQEKKDPKMLLLPCYMQKKKFFLIILVAIYFLPNNFLYLFESIFYHS